MSGAITLRFPLSSWRVQRKVCMWKNNCGWIVEVHVWVQLKCDGPRWRTGGEVKGKLANGVGSQYSLHYLGTWCIQHYYRWCSHLDSSVSPKTKSGFWECAITFQTQSTSLDYYRSVCRVCLRINSVEWVINCNTVTYSLLSAWFTNAYLFIIYGDWKALIENNSYVCQ